MDTKDTIKAAQEALSGIAETKDSLEKAAIKGAVEALEKAKGNLEQAAIQTTIETLNKKTEKAGLSRKNAKKTPAKNIYEFMAKYPARFTPANAGKAYLLNFLLDVYSMTEKGVQGTLWNMEALKSKIQTEEDVRSFDAYYYLTEWLRVLYENSRTMRNALQGELSAFYNTATTILAAENIRQCIIPNPQADKLQELDGEELREALNANPGSVLTLWLHTIDLEAYTPQSDGAYLLYALRTNIGEGLRYLVAYHTFIDVIADFTGIPECAYLKIQEEPLRKSLDNLNNALELLRNNIKQYREPEIKAACASRPETSPTNEWRAEDFLPASLTKWTPEYLDATMEYFRPVGDEPPVPEERVLSLRNTIKRDFKREYINWYVLYTRYSISYRIPPEKRSAPTPTGRKGAKASAEEGK